MTIKQSAWPTLDEVEQYIDAADSELGPRCCDPFAEKCRAALREVAAPRDETAGTYMRFWGEAGKEHLRHALEEIERAGVVVIVMPRAEKLISPTFEEWGVQKQ